MIAVGVGFSSRCSAAALEALVAAVLAAAGRTGAGGYLASHPRRRGSGLVEAVAAATGLVVRYPSPAALARWQGATTVASAPAQAALGVASVAEAAALAALADHATGGGVPVLRIHRRTGAGATAAVATLDTPNCPQEGP